MRMKVWMIALLWTLPQVAVANDSPSSQQYKALLLEYEEEGGARAFAKRFLQLAEQHSDEPEALDALLWVVNHVRGKPDTTRAIEMLEKNHLQSDKLGGAFENIVASRSVAAEGLLRASIERSPHRNVRAQACYHLARLLDLEASLVEQLEAQPELAPRVLQYYGKDYGEHLSSLDSSELVKERERTYERMLKTFPDLELKPGVLGEVAEKMLFRIRNLSIGRVAPEIDGEDVHGNSLKLSDFRGNVVMLTFWGHW